MQSVLYTDTAILSSDIHEHHKSLVSHTKSVGKYHADDTITQHAVLASRHAAQRPTKARAGEESVYADHTQR